MLAGPRYLYALAADGFGPRFLARLHPHYRTPALAILTQTAIALPLALSGSFKGLATLSVIARLATYIGTAAAVPVLRRKYSGRPARRASAGRAAHPDRRHPGLPGAFAASAETRNLIARGIAIVGRPGDRAAVAADPRLRLSPIEVRLN